MSRIFFTLLVSIALTLGAYQIAQVKVATADRSNAAEAAAPSKNVEAGSSQEQAQIGGHASQDKDRAQYMTNRANDFFGARTVNRLSTGQWIFLF